MCLHTKGIITEKTLTNRVILTYYRYHGVYIIYNTRRKFYFAIYFRSTVKQPYKFIKKTGYLFRENCAKYTVTCYMLQCIPIYRYAVYIEFSYDMNWNKDLLCSKLYIKDMGHLYNIERNLCIQWLNHTQFSRKNNGKIILEYIWNFPL